MTEMPRNRRWNASWFKWCGVVLVCMTMLSACVSQGTGAKHEERVPPTAESPHLPGGEQMGGRTERIVATFNELTKDNMHILDGFYHPDVVFEDPLGRIEGLPALKRYYLRMYRNVETIRFDFSDHLVDGDTHLAAWTMRMQVKGFNRGREIVLDGNSLIRFGEGDLVTYHRDYFDMGAMVYEHIPVIGYLVRRVKKRLQKH